jgi:glutamine phosphoribosylpyrophosphate amidotransferase
MCGICGLVDYNHKSAIELPSAVRHMTNRLVHRGPDAEGFWQEPSVALGHRRLSIIDLSGSIQPMQDSSGRYILVFNGEIYNYLELRIDLEKRGIRFRTKGDTEVLLAAYITYSSDCLEHLNGMFAFAVWDRQEQVLFAARDRMGVKPLFFGQGWTFPFVHPLLSSTCVMDSSDPLTPYSRGSMNYGRPISCATASRDLKSGHTGALHCLTPGGNKEPNPSLLKSCVTLFALQYTFD